MAGGDIEGLAGGSGLAAKFNKSFEIMHQPSDPPLSNAAAATGITGQADVSISPACLWQLRNEAKPNPTAQHLRAIAGFFGVPTSYLSDCDIDSKIEVSGSLLQVLRGNGIRDLAMRASDLTPQALRSLSVMADHARWLEHLPPGTPEKRSLQCH